MASHSFDLKERLLDISAQQIARADSLFEAIGNYIEAEKRLITHQIKERTSNASRVLTAGSLLVIWGAFTLVMLMLSLGFAIHDYYPTIAPHNIALGLAVLSGLCTLICWQITYKSYRKAFLEPLSKRHSKH